MYSRMMQNDIERIQFAKEGILNIDSRPEECSFRKILRDFL